MHAVLRPALLAMLGDPDPQLRAEALGFWNSALPKAVGLRLQSLLQDSLAEPGLLVSPVPPAIKLELLLCVCHNFTSTGECCMLLPHVTTL